jgi:succinate dehydrogenase / fumarate reductase membrane anchor subunit
MRDTPLWTWHVIAGLIILVLLGLHMGIMHLNGVLHLATFNPNAEAPIDWANVVHRAKQAFFAWSYVILLGAALFHGLYGLRNIIFELNPSDGLRTFISGLLLLVGLGLFVFGTWASFAARTVAMAG